MQLMNQQQALIDLTQLAEQRKQAVVISGAYAVGKTYLAREYSKLLGIPDFTVIEPKVNDIKSTIDSLIQLETPIVLCIENLDLGVAAASYTLLKFLEEPKSNIYIVITCRNISQIPDTILSRAILVSVPNILSADIDAYAKTKDSPLIQTIQNDNVLWRCIRNFVELDMLIALSDKNISYFKDVIGNISPKNSVSSIVWKMQKFPDGSAVPTEILLRYLMYSNSAWYPLCLRALNDLALNRMSAHAILSKLVFELKYAV